MFHASKVLHRKHILPTAISLGGVPFRTYIVWTSPKQGSLEPVGVRWQVVGLGVLTVYRKPPVFLPKSQQWASLNFP